jgi:tripartite ATP-independent transporter DctM subunit
MVPWTLALAVLMGGLSAVMALGTPVAIAFLATNILGALLYLGGEPGLNQLARNAVVSVTSFALTPIPLFVLMGEVLFQTGLALRAIEAVERLLQRVPGRLAIVAIVAGTIFSAISGSTIATTALLGSLLLPEMLRRGYEPRFAMGPIMGIGGVDMLIPPSALAVLLGSLAGISISKLLVAGIVPGILLSSMFVLYILFRAKFDPRLAPQDDFPPSAGWDRLRPFVVYVLPLVLIFAVVVLSMSAGWATPTESAAVGASTTILVAALYRALTLRALAKALLGTAAISGTILFIIVGATTFSQILSFSGAAGGLVEAVTRAELGPMAILLGMLAILLVLGCFVDQVSMMLIALPFFMPLVAKLGFDPIWFGVLFLICMQLGLLTPPFGLLLFTMKSVAPKSATLREINQAAMPYVVMGLLVLAIVVLIPATATWLPGAIFDP